VLTSGRTAAAAGAQGTADSAMTTSTWGLGQMRLPGTWPLRATTGRPCHHGSLLLKSGRALVSEVPHSLRSLRRRAETKSGRVKTATGYCKGYLSVPAVCYLIYLTVFCCHQKLAICEFSCNKPVMPKILQSYPSCTRAALIVRMPEGT
jgi:hypothetical protein